MPGYQTGAQMMDDGATDDAAQAAVDTGIGGGPALGNLEDEEA